MTAAPHQGRIIDLTPAGAGDRSAGFAPVELIVLSEKPADRCFFNVCLSRNRNSGFARRAAVPTFPWIAFSPGASRYHLRHGQNVNRYGPVRLRHLRTLKLRQIEVRMSILITRKSKF
jgi:hypothetical protein